MRLLSTGIGSPLSIGIAIHDQRKGKKDDHRKELIPKGDDIGKDAKPEVG
jgi:hypothetical protein